MQVEAGMLLIVGFIALFVGFLAGLASGFGLTLVCERRERKSAEPNPDILPFRSSRPWGDKP